MGQRVACNVLRSYLGGGGGPGGGGMWLDVVILGLPDRFGFFFGFLVAGV